MLKEMVKSGWMDGWMGEWVDGWIEIEWKWSRETFKVTPGLMTIRLIWQFIFLFDSPRQNPGMYHTHLVSTT